jgi:hypothetical protein
MDYIKIIYYCATVTFLLPYIVIIICITVELGLVFVESIRIV